MSDVLEVKKKRYEVSDEVKAVADEVMVTKNMDLKPATIKYVLVFPGINKKTAARCMLSNPMLKLFGECDYIIQVSGDLWNKLDDDRKKILMYHELLHVFPVQNAKSGNWDFHIRSHDVEDFFVILKNHGVDWISDLRTLFSSVYDIDDLDTLSL